MRRARRCLKNGCQNWIALIASDWNELTVDEGVQDGHGTVGDTGVGVDLLEDLVDVGRVGLLAGLGALLLVARDGGGLLASLLLLSGSLASRSLAGGGGSLLKWESVECAKEIASKTRDWSCVLRTCACLGAISRDLGRLTRFLDVG